MQWENKCRKGRDHWQVGLLSWDNQRFHQNHGNDIADGYIHNIFNMILKVAWHISAPIFEETNLRIWCYAIGSLNVPQ
jgi:hypothetical protein